MAGERGRLEMLPGSLHMLLSLREPATLLSTLHFLILLRVLLKFFQAFLEALVHVNLRRTTFLKEAVSIFERHTIRSILSGDDRLQAKSNLLQTLLQAVLAFLTRRTASENANMGDLRNVVLGDEEF